MTTDLTNIDAISPGKSGRATTHSIERTSPKGPGQKFVGRCRLCGAEGLTFANIEDRCSNPDGVSGDQALIEAIDGPSA